MDHYPPTVSPIKPCEPIRPAKQVSIARIKACQRVFVHLRPQANNVEMTMTLWDAGASMTLPETTCPPNLHLLPGASLMTEVIKPISLSGYYCLELAERG